MEFIKYCRNNIAPPTIPEELVELCQEYPNTKLYFDIQGNLICVYFQLSGNIKEAETAIKKVPTLFPITCFDEKGEYYSHVFCVSEKTYQRENPEENMATIAHLIQDVSDHQILPIVTSYPIFDSIMQWYQNPFYMDGHTAATKDSKQYKDFIAKPTCDVVFINKAFQDVVGGAVVKSSEDLIVRRCWAADMAIISDYLALKGLFILTASAVLGNLIQSYVKTLIDSKRLTSDITVKDLTQDEINKIKTFIEA